MAQTSNPFVIESKKILLIDGMMFFYSLKIILIKEVIKCSGIIRKI